VYTFFFLFTDASSFISMNICKQWDPTKTVHWGKMKWIMYKSPKCMMCHIQHLKISIETEHQQQWPYKFQWAKRVFCSKIVRGGSQAFLCIRETVRSWVYNHASSWTLPIAEKCVFSYSLTMMRSVMKRLTSCIVHNKTWTSANFGISIIDRRL
jgi:hypothetical protein